MRATPFVLVVSVAVAAGCVRPLPLGTDASAGAGGSLGQAGTGGTFTPTRKVDMLFVINDSSTRLLQDNLLATSRPSCRLADRPAGPSRPSHRASSAPTWARVTARSRAATQAAARTGSSSTPRAAPAPRPASRPAPPSSPTTARTGITTATWPTCSRVSPRSASSGCGFEHQLAAITRALGADGRPPPGENQGFLRARGLPVHPGRCPTRTTAPPRPAPACSIPQATTSHRRLAPSNFRCNEFGHLCNGVKPPRLAPSGSAGIA